MTAPSGRLAAPLACALLAGACATTHDRDLADARRAALFGSATESARSAGATPEAGLDGAARDDALHGDAPPRRSLDPAVLAEPDLARWRALALERSARLRAAYAEWRTAAEEIELASTLPDPRVSWTEFLEEVQTRTGPQERRLGVSQALPWPGELDAKARVAERRAEAAWQRVEETRLAVLRDVEVAYWAYALLGRELEIAREQLDLLHGLEPAVVSRVRTGGGQQDLLRLQVEIGRLGDELARLERRRPALAARLADALTLPAADVLPAVQPGDGGAGDGFTAEGRGLLPMPRLVEPTSEAVVVAAARARALERSPALAALAAELAAQREGVEVARFRGKPSFMVGVDWFVTGEALAPNAPGSGDDPIALGVSLSLPVWRGAVAAAERQARHRVRAARERLTAASSTLVASVEEEAFGVDDAARRIALYRDSLVPRAAEALELTLAAYRAGSTSVVDLIDAERALLELARASWRACADFYSSAARLSVLTGAEVLEGEARGEMMETDDTTDGDER